MPKDDVEFDYARHRMEWLEKLRDEFLKLDKGFPPGCLVPEENLPKWVQNLGRELAATIYPVAKLKEGLKLTPKHLGAIIGHTCAHGVWIMEGFEHIANIPDQTPDTVEVSTERVAAGEKIVSNLVTVWYPELRRLAKRSLCSCVDQSYEDMTEFLSAYANAFSRKPKTIGGSDIGNSATQIYFFMISFWPAINAMKSVRELHECLVKIFGPHQVGDLKRIEKICQRIELHYRKPGRPKKRK